MLQLFIGLATALTGGVVAAFVTYRLNATKEHVFHMRKKAEELFLSFDKHDKQIGMHFLGYFPLLKGQIDYNATLDMQIERDTDKGEAAATFKMLHSIYYPNLSESVTAFEASLAAIHQVLSAHKQAYLEGDGSGFLQPFTAALRNHERSADALRAAIISEGRRVMELDTLWPDVARLTAIGAAVLRGARSLAQRWRPQRASR